MIMTDNDANALRLSAHEMIRLLFKGKRRNALVLLQQQAQASIEELDAETKTNEQPHDHGNPSSQD